MHSPLTSDEQAKIRAEEIFRHEVRASFEPKRSRAWAFLNSAFGLWLLGTVSIGLLTWTYGEIRDRQAQRAESRSLKRRLRTEVGARIDAAAYVFRSTQFHEPRPEVDDYGEAADILGGRAGHTTYPEFTSRKLSSLLVHLRDTASCRNAVLEPIIGQAQHLEVEFSKARRRLVPSLESEKLDFPKARAAEDRRFEAMLTQIERSLSGACD